MTTSKCKILKAIALPLLAIIFVASVLLGVFADRIDFFANADSQTPTSTNPNAWDGVSSDTSFYTFSSNTLHIYTPNQLKGLQTLAGNGFTFEGLTVQLEADIDLGGHDWYPIENFAGIFDGNGHTVSNGVLNIVGSANVGFFGTVDKIVTIKNLTLKNFSSKVSKEQLNSKSVGLLLGENTASGTRIVNCDVVDSALNFQATGYPDSGKNGLLVGRSKAAILIDGCTISNSILYEASAMGYRFGGILGGNTASEYDSVVRNCNMWNTYLLSYQNPASGTNYGLICGEGNAVTVENFHTNMKNYTAGSFYNGKYDLSQVGLSQQVVSALDNYPLYDAYAKIYTSRLFGSSSYFTGNTSYDGILLEKSFLVDGVDKLSNIYANKGSLSVAENVQNVKIEFDVEVDAVVTVGGVTVGDTNPDGKIVEFAVGDGFKQTVADIYFDGILVAHYNLLSGGSMDYSLTMEGNAIEENHEFLTMSGTSIHVTDSAKNIGVTFNGIAPEGTTLSVNGVTADSDGNVTLAEIPSTLSLCIQSGTGTQEIALYSVTVWNQLATGNDSIYYRDIGSYEWTVQDGTFSYTSGDTSSSSQANFIVRNAQQVTITYSIDWKITDAWSPNQFQVYLDGTNEANLVVNEEASANYSVANKSYTIDTNGEVHQLIVLRYASWSTVSVNESFSLSTATTSDETGSATATTSPIVNANKWAKPVKAESEEITATTGEKYSDNVYYTVTSGTTAENTWTLSDKQFVGYIGAGNLSSQDKTILTLYFFGVDSVTIDYLYNFSSSATTLYGALSITDITDGANTPLLSGICGSTDTNQTFSKKYDTVGNYVWEIAIEASMHFPSVHPQTAWINQITAGIAGIDVNISYNSEYGNVTNIYAFSDTPLVNGTFELGTKIQPWAVAKDGYKYVGYKLNGGDLIASNGDIFYVFEPLTIELVFQPEIVIPDEKLEDFTFEFTQGDNVISEQAKFYTNYTVEAYPSDNSLLLKAPYLNIGETAKLYINNEFVLTMQEESETFYGLMYNIADNAKVDIVYSKEGSSDVTFTFFIQFEQPMEGSLISDELLEISWENDALYPFTYDLGLSSADRAAYSAGNSGVHDSASAIKFTVHGNGVLFFDYYISSEDDSVYGDFGVFAINNETLKLDQDDNFLYDNNLLPFTGMTGTTYVSLAGNNPYMGYLGAELVEGNYQNKTAEGGRLDDKAAGDLGWVSWQIPINTDVTGSDVNDIYIGYSRGSLDNSETYEDTFAIANVRFVSQQYTISAGVSNEQGGSVKSNPEIPADGLTYSGGNYTLTATVNDGYTFYGWADSVSGELVSINKTYVATVTSNVSYTAIIEPNGTYTARINGNFYQTLEEALTAANEGVTGDLILYKDVTFDKDSTIPEGIHLIVPYSATDTTGYKEGGNKDRVSWNVDVDPYITVTVNSGVTLTVDGQLTLGGVQHHLSQTAQGHTSGDYSQIVNNGNIVLNGDMNVIGRVTGNGVLTVNSGATLKQPFLVNNYSGGTNTLNYYEDGHFPFVQFATVNIECKQIINYGAKVSGSTSLFFFSSITTQDVVLMDAIENKETSGEGSLLWMQQGSRIEVTYDGTKCVNELHGTTNKVHLGDSGLTTLDIYGNVTLGEFSLIGYGSFDMILALPYTYNIVVKEGTLTVPADRAYKIMPGAKVTVESGATLDVLGRLYVYDGLIQADKSGKLYPNSTTLTNYGFSASGNLVVDGTLKVGANATFAGIVQTTGTSGVIEIAEGAKLTDTIKEGSEYGYTNDKTVLTLSARVFGLTHNTLTTLEAGKTYKAYSGKQFVLESFSVDSAARMNHTSEIINQQMQGIFLVDEGDGLYGVYGDVYIGENVAGVTVNISGREYTTDENGKIYNAYLVIDTDGKFDYYTVGKQTNTFEGVYGTEEAFVTLTQVIKGGELDENNNYLREFDTNGITKDLDVKAYITYYGGDKSESFALTGDIADGKLVANVTFTNATYPVLDSTVTVKQTSTAIATYIEEVYALATAEGSQLVTKATKAYEAYTALRDGRQNEELEFLEGYLASYEGYFKVAKSLAIVGQVNYGDDTATANVTYIDGTTAETTVNNTAYTVQNGAVVATFQWEGNYQEVAYTLSAETQNVAKVTLTVSVDNKESVYGDALETLTAQVSRLVNGDTQENVLVLTKAGTNNAGTHDITASLKGNYQYFYNLVATKGTYTVTKRAITVVIEDKTSVYGDKLETLTATTTDSVANADGLDKIVTLEKAIGTNAGTYAITGECVSGNYTVTFTNESGDAQNGTYTVIKREVTVTVNSASSLYGDDIASLTATVTEGSVLEADGTIYTLSTTATSASNVGSYDITGTCTNGNYSITFDNTKGSYTVTKREIDVTIEDKSSVYGNALAELTATTTDDVANGEGLANIVTLEKAIGTNAGTYAITGECVDGNYTVNFTNGTYTITKREITVTVNSASSLYGDDIANLTATVTEGSVLEADGTIYTLSTDATSTSNVGNYDITGTCKNDNYQVTFVNTADAYAITQRPVAVVIDDKTSVYGENLVSLTMRYAEGSLQLVGGQTLTQVVTLTKAQGTDAGTYAIAGSYTDGNYDITFTNGTYTITPRQTDVTVADHADVMVSKTDNIVFTAIRAYGNATLSGATFRILKEGVLIATVAANGEVTLQEGKQLSVGEYTVVAEYSDSNFEMNFVEGTLTVVEDNDYYTVDFGFQTNTQVYDGEEVKLNVTVNVTDTGATVEGFTVRIRRSGQEVQSMVNVGNYEITVFVDNVEYSTSYTITSRPVSVVIDDKTSVYGESLVELTMNYAEGSLQLVGGQTLPQVVTLAKAQGTDAGTYAIAGSYTDGNYDITFTNGTYTITQRAITVTVDNKESVYGNEIATLTGKVTSGSVLAGDGTVYTLSTTATSAGDVGSYDINGTCINDNYQVTFENETDSYTVTKRAITVTVTSTSSVYGDDIATLTGKVTVGTVIYGDGTVYTLSTDATSTSNVGSYDITGTCTNDNYQVTFENETDSYTVTKREITVTVNSASSLYGDNIASLTATVTEGRVLEADGTVYTLSTKATSASNVGSYDITGTCINDNYQVTFENETDSYTVTKRTITVTVTSTSSVYGDDIATLTGKVTVGTVIYGDGTVYTLSTDATSTSNVGSYDITGTCTNDNYQVTFENETDSYTVTKREVTVKVNSASSLYGNDIASLTATVTEGSVLEADGTVYTLSTTAKSASNVGSYDITGTCTNDNYQVTFVNTADAYAITQRPVAVVIDDKTSVYGENLVSLTMRYAEGSLQLVGGQTLTQVVTLTKAQGTDAGTYAIAGSYTDGNYYITFTNGTYTITERKITVTVDGKTSVYGDEIVTLTGKVTSGSVLEADGTIYTLSTTAKSASDVGRYDITGTCTNDNYSITFANTKGSYTVTKRAITVVIDDKTSVYGNNLETLTATTTDGVANADGIATIVALTKDEGATVGTYDITGECVNGNYTVTFTNGTYTITKRDITVTVTDVETDNTVTFEALTQKFRWTVSQGNIVDGDDLNVEVYLVIGGTEITADNFRATFCGGTHTLTARFDNDNYNISLQNGTLSVTLPRVTVVDVQTQYVYSGSAIVPFHWETNISGKLPSADEYSFKATYYAADDVNRENPLQIVNAGDYVMVVSIVHTSAYQFADEAQTEFDIHVAKKDISDSISFVGIEDVLIVTNEVFVSATADDYDVAIDVTLKRGETEVESVSVAGDYTATAVVNDVNYTGSKQRSFTAIADAYAKLNDFVQKVDKLDGTFTQAQAQLIVELRGIAQGFTQDELLQIENTPTFKTAYEEYKQAWTQFVQQATEKVELAEKTYDGLLAVVATVTAMLLAAGVVIKKWLSC